MPWDPVRRFMGMTCPDRVSAGVYVTGAIVFLIMAYGSSHGIMHYDTGLYHAQAIHWTESYGLVPGLANLHTRLGYNSSAFVLNALYSFGFTGRSFHVSSGFAALLLSWECIVHPILLRKPLFSVPNMARIAGIYYLLMIYDEMVSPASDYYMVCLAFILVIRWLDAEQHIPERQDKNDAAYALSGSDDRVISAYCMLSFLACFIFTVKLSGALLVLLAILPGVYLIRRKRYSVFAGCILTGAFIILPHLIRNVIISGRLLYPSVALDIFDLPWKVPRGIAEYDYKEIQVYGRNMTDVLQYDLPIYRWFGPWFKSLSFTDRILTALAMVAVICFVIQCILKVRNPSRHISCVTAVVIVCCIFWLFTSPLMRYGCLFVYLTDALVWGGMLCDMVNGSGRESCRRTIRLAAIGFFSLLCGYKSVMWAGETVRGYRPDVWILQQDYDRFDTFTYEIMGGEPDGTEPEEAAYTDGSRNHVAIYAPAEGDRTGYYDFPSSPRDMSGEIRLRGDGLKDGFEPK